MRLLSFMKKKRSTLTDEQVKWNRMWELWAEGQSDSPYAELMLYQSEINNGGHDQFFFNVENTGDLPKTLEELEKVLPAELRQNLQNAYEAYLVSEEKESDEKASEILEQCDNTFYENEKQINDILQKYANGITTRGNDEI